MEVGLHCQAVQKTEEEATLPSTAPGRGHAALGWRELCLPFQGNHSFPQGLQDRLLCPAVPAVSEGWHCSPTAGKQRAVQKRGELQGYSCLHPWGAGVCTAEEGETMGSAPPCPALGIGCWAKHRACQRESLRTAKNSLACARNRPGGILNRVELTLRTTVKH